jgi:hypothetical protein
MTQLEKFLIDVEPLVRTSEKMVKESYKLKVLLLELAYGMSECQSLKSEINAIAVKLGLEPIPEKAQLSLEGNPTGIPLEMTYSFENNFSQIE